MSAYELYEYDTGLWIKNNRPGSKEDQTTSRRYLHLSIEARDPHSIAIEEVAELPQDTEPTRVLQIDLIYGFYSLLRGPYVAVITEGQRVGTGPSGEWLYKIMKMDLLPIRGKASKISLSPQQLSDERQYIAHIKSILHATPESFYYSYDYPLTSNLQLIHQKLTSKSPSTSTSSNEEPINVTDERFFWNVQVLEPLLNNTSVRNLEDWVVPVINGFIEVKQKTELDGAYFDFIFITRRSWQRVGTRFCVRGTDKHGHVANFAETEMILVKENGQLTAFVQIRGSIPLYWDQLCTLKYMPRTRYNSTTASKNGMDWNEFAFNAHMRELVSIYQKVTVINLVDKHGKSTAVRDQAQLGVAFGKYCKRFNAMCKSHEEEDMVSYVWFDFHHECRKLQWHNLSKLMAEIEPQLEDQETFQMTAQGQVLSTQKGVFRTNCMDNLDRTNVVQSLIGRRSLLRAITGLDVPRHQVLDSPYVTFEHVFKNLWADNADAVSRVYAGTGALKTDFTRTGTRTFKGKLMDGLNSVVRYGLNNFHDGIRQDALDLVVGNYVPDHRLPSPFSFGQTHKLLVLAMEGILMCMVIFYSIQLLPEEKDEHSFLPNVLPPSHITMILTICACMCYVVLKMEIGYDVRRHFVCTPRFYPYGYPNALK